MEFDKTRRQQFLGELHSAWMRNDCSEGIANIEVIMRDALAKNDLDYASDRASFQSMLRFQHLVLRYTAGEPIGPLREELEQVVASYERYGEYKWKYADDRNEVVFEFTYLDDYCTLMQLIGLCYLLHRRDLLPRIAALQDGEGGTSNGGSDTLYEEFMACGLGADKRFQTDHLCQLRPYENLFYGLTETTPAKGLKEIDLFLKHWYKDLAGTGWHDSHKPDEAGNQSGYYGYWSFEAGAAVLLLGIEDDSSLHKYLYYPKDMVAWARANAALNDANEKASTRLRALAGEPCPREGWWVAVVKTDSRRHFKAGDVMPDLKSEAGITIWQWDSKQGV
jgi:hypothetical protein